jgi:transposase
MIADALGNPLQFTVTGAEQADITQASELVRRIPGAGAVVADKGYDSDALVAEIESTGAQSVIPPRRNRCDLRHWDKDRYRARHLIENLFARLKQFRRLATRYDKLADRFVAFITLACLMAWMA